MKIIAIGDTHGRSKWKQIASNEEFDKLVFIGDYFDSREGILPHDQKDNFKDIVAYKKANMDKVVLLFGNHDYHYLRSTNESYSGFQEWQKTDIGELLHSAIDDGLMQMCYAHQNLLFSHAGVTKTWCENNLIPPSTIVGSINELFKYKPNSFQFTSGKNYSSYGDDVEQSPIWVRPTSLEADAVYRYIQVVGHTTQDKIELSDDVIYIDTIGTSGEYFIWEDFKTSVGKIKK